MTDTARSGPRPPLGAPAHLALALFFLAFAVYGSLVPFRARPLDLGEAVARWRDVCARPVGIGSRSDFASNVLLFFPLGYLFMAALCVDRHPAFGLPEALLVLPLLCGLSAAVEFTQLWFPDRTSSLNDVTAESLGGAAGAALWLALGQRITARLRAALAAPGRRELTAGLLPGYLVFLVLVHLLPLDLTISPVEVWRKYKAGHVVLVPFAAPAGEAAKLPWTAAYYLPLGAFLAARRGGRPATAAGALAFGGVVAAGVEFLKLFVVSRYSDATNVLVGSLAVLAGWSLARVWRARGLAGPAAPARLALLAAWAGVLTLLEWYPFDFVRDPGRWWQRLGTVSPVPFADLYAGHVFNAFDQVLQKTLLFLPVGALLARPGRSAVLAVLAGLALSTALEVGQLGLPTRFPSVTDVVIGTGGAWLGCVLARRYLRAAGEVRAPEEAVHACVPVAAD